MSARTRDETVSVAIGILPNGAMAEVGDGGGMNQVPTLCTLHQNRLWVLSQCPSFAHGVATYGWCRWEFTRLDPYRKGAHPAHAGTLGWLLILPLFGPLLLPGVLWQPVGIVVSMIGYKKGMGTSHLRMRQSTRAASVSFLDDRDPSRAVTSRRASGPPCLGLGCRDCAHTGRCQSLPSPVRPLPLTGIELMPGFSRVAPARGYRS